MMRSKLTCFGMILFIMTSLSGLSAAKAFGNKLRMAGCEAALVSLSNLALSDIQSLWSGNRLASLDRFKANLDELRSQGLLGAEKYSALASEYERIRNVTSQEISRTSTAVGSPRCFVAGTMVDTPQGPRPIETLRVGDQVYSFDFGKNKIVVSRVLHTMVRDNKDFIKVHLSSGLTLEVTPDHLFFSPDKNQFMAINDFVEGSSFLIQNEGEISVVPVYLAKNENRGERGTVYNIEVADHHNYFVGGVLVHNARPIQ